MEKRLDLSRQELSPIADRYFPHTALIVRGKHDSEEVEDLLHQKGWQVKVCHGPEHVRCPLSQGRLCGLRDSADAAIVYVTDDWDEKEALMERMRCAGVRSSKAVLAIEGADDEARRMHRVTLVGSGSPAAVVAEAEHFVERDVETN